MALDFFGVSNSDVAMEVQAKPISISIAIYCASPCKLLVRRGGVHVPVIECDTLLELVYELPLRLELFVAAHVDVAGRIPARRWDDLQEAK